MPSKSVNYRGLRVPSEKKKCKNLQHPGEVTLVANCQSKKGGGSLKNSRSTGFESYVITKSKIVVVHT